MQIKALLVVSGLLASVAMLVTLISDMDYSSSKPQATISSTVTSVESISDLELYEDPDYGFTMVVPVGWSRIVLDDGASGDAELANPFDSGYAVGFESPRPLHGDQFADYILVELLPGSDSGLFETVENDQRMLTIADTPISYDRLYINHATEAATDVDLVVYQRGVQALGYTVSLYAIGEPANEQTLFEAFQIMLRTYTQTQDPFVVI